MLLTWETRGQRAGAALPVSAMDALFASRRRFASEAAGLRRGPEAARGPPPGSRPHTPGRAKQSKEDVGHAPSASPRCWRRPQNVARGVRLCKSTSMQRVWGKGGVLVKPSRTWHNTLERVWACLANPFRKLQSPLDILQMPVSPLRARSDFAIQDKGHQLLGREIGRGHKRRSY